MEEAQRGWLISAHERSAVGLVLRQVLMVTAHQGYKPFKGSGFSLAPVPHFHLFEGHILRTALKCLSTRAVGQPRIEPPGDSWSIPPVLTSPALERG